MLGSELKFTTKSAEETVELGRMIGSRLKPGDVIAMEGTLAAGKTTITKGIAEAMGVEETVTSPTFCLISEYSGTKMPLYHMDVYRLDGAEDFLNLGVEELLYGQGVCIIEWSEKVRSALPQKTVTMNISASEDGTRTIILRNWKNGSIK